MVGIFEAPLSFIFFGQFLFRYKLIYTAVVGKGNGRIDLLTGSGYQALS
jgi:hypothetical protein